MVARAGQFWMMICCRRIRLYFKHAVGRSLGAAITISADLAAASHRPTVLFLCEASSAGDHRSPLQRTGSAAVAPKPGMGLSPRPARADDIRPYVGAVGIRRTLLEFGHVLQGTPSPTIFGRCVPVVGVGVLDDPADPAPMRAVLRRIRSHLVGRDAHIAPRRTSRIHRRTSAHTYQSHRRALREAPLQ